MIKLLKLVQSGSNLFQGRGWRAPALFAGDISCLETLLRNAPPTPTRFSHLPLRMAETQRNTSLTTV